MPDRGFHRPGYAEQRFDGDDFLPTFDFAEIFGVQIHFFGQLFLGESGFLAPKANGVTQNLAVT